MSSEPQKTTEQAVRDGVLKALGVAAVVVLIVGLVVFLAYAVLSSDDDLQCSQENLERSSQGLPAKDC